MSNTTSDEGSEQLINNRQNGRRRGRGGGAPRPNGSSNGPDRGNRIDNRARGNASQLHEKYKTLARDAQMQGDRVNTEYYLQFADHYFRVLSETRGRFEEQQQRRPREDFANDRDYQAQGDYQDDYDDDGDGGDDRRAPEPQNQQRAEPRYEQQRSDRNGDRNDQRNDRGPERNGDRPGRVERQPRQEAAPAPQPEHRAPPAESFTEDRVEAEPAPRRRGRPRRDAGVTNEAAPPLIEERIEIDRLPPAFTPEPKGEAAIDAAGEDKPRRRGRKPRAAGEAVVIDA